jgi:uncharacterized protein (DUF2147 family)
MRLSTMLFVAFQLLFGPGSVTAAEVTGSWQASNGDATVKVTRCGAFLCAEIIALKEPIDPDTGRPLLDKNNVDETKRSRTVVGLQLFLAAKPSGENLWRGKVYNPDDGKTYDATMSFDGAHVTVTGCVMGGLICDSDIWQR